jgi:hypothetical protein
VSGRASRVGRRGARVVCSRESRPGCCRSLSGLVVSSHAAAPVSGGADEVTV